MSTSHDQIEIEKMHDEQRMARAKYGPLLDTVSRILFERDPIDINFGSNTGEYDSEATTILLRIDEAKTQNELLRIIHDEFVRWFDEAITGPESKYEQIAADIWSAYRRAVPA